MNKFLSMAALALVGAMTVSCSSDNDITDQPQQPENKSNLVTLTTTVGLDGGATTRALTETGVKTFAVDDQIAVIYTKNGGTVTKAVSEKLISTDIASGSKSATFTVTLDDPDKTKQVTYIYPAAMAGSTDVDYTKLNSQDGTLESLQTKYDLCTKSGAWDSDNLPSLTLENQLAILAINLKNSTDITSTITGMTISDGTNTYAVSRSAAAGPIYLAIQPTSSATIYVTATDGTNEYGKRLSGKTYAADNGYPVTWNMSELEKVVWNNTNVFNSSNEITIDRDYTTATFENVTISFTGSGAASHFYIYDEEFGSQLFVNGGQGGAFTFTAPSGKIFTKIEIINSVPVTFTPYGDWTKPENNKIMWSGAASSTVTLAASGFVNCPNVTSIVFTMMKTQAAAAKTLAEATAGDIGKIAGKDGKIYATKAAAEAVATGNAVAMIAYVGTASDCAHGLAIALADESGTKNYGAAGTACSGKAAVTGGTWRLPSVKDWQYMFIGCGASGSYSDNPSSMSYSGLASKLTTAQGDALQELAYYWSSSEFDPGYNAWNVIFDGGNAHFLYDLESGEYQVRACLAF